MWIEKFGDNFNEISPKIVTYTPSKHTKGEIIKYQEKIE